MLYAPHTSLKHIWFVMKRDHWQKLCALCLTNFALQVLYPHADSILTIYVTETNVLVLYLACVCCDMLVSLQLWTRRMFVLFASLGAVIGIYQVHPLPSPLPLPQSTVHGSAHGVL